MIVFLGLGSNLGNRKNIIEQAIENIKAFSEIIKVSPLYESSAWGFNSNNEFINMAIQISTELTAEQLIENILHIEKQLGREQKTTTSYQDRTIDIDILFYGDQILNSENLTIPHPKISERLFVLKPLNDISPNYIHPILNKTISELLAICDDESEIKKCN